MNKENPSNNEIDNILQLYQNEKFEDAEKLIIPLTKRFPNSQIGWKIFGAISQQLGRKSDALNANQKAVELSPQDAEARNNLGVVLQELGRLDDAEASCRKAIALKQDYAEAFYNLANILKDKNKLNEAVTNYVQAITFKSNYASAHNNLGVAFAALERFTEAETSYKEAIKLNPYYSEAYYNLGNTLQEIGNLVEAEGSLRQAVKLQPNYAQAHSNLGIILVKLGRLEEGVEAHKTSLKIQPNNGEFLSNLSNAKSQTVSSWHVPMMNEDGRNEAYRKALSTAINGGELVLDIGTGAGLLSMISADCGAKEIVTCEMSPIISKTAKTIIKKNGFHNKIKVINKNSKKLIIGEDIPRKVDLLVSEILSSEFVGEGIQSSVIDAKRRLLKKDGKIIPEGGAIMIALIENTGKLAKELFVDQALGYDIREFNNITADKNLIILEDEPVILSKPIEAFKFDFRSLENIYSSQKIIEIAVSKSGICAGVVQWLKINLYEEIEYQNHPVEIHRMNSVSGWRTPIFKFANPINVSKGTTVKIKGTLKDDNSWFCLNSN